MEKPLPLIDALQLIRQHFNDGNIISTKHFRERLKDRNISIQDVTEIVKSGTIKKDPEKDLITSEWKYRIEGKSIDGIETVIIISIQDKKTSKLITTF
jgi:hypothetical protein